MGNPYRASLVTLAFVPVLLTACGDGATAPAVTVAVSISPSNASLVAGESAQFTATVTGASATGVTWTASAGAVSGTGNTVTYTAPATAGHPYPHGNEHRGSDSLRVGLDHR